MQSRLPRSATRHDPSLVNKLGLGVLWLTLLAFVVRLAGGALLPANTVAQGTPAIGWVPTLIEWTAARFADPTWGRHLVGCVLLAAMVPAAAALSAAVSARRVATSAVVAAAWASVSPTLVQLAAASLPQLAMAVAVVCFTAGVTGYSRRRRWLSLLWCGASGVTAATAAGPLGVILCALVLTEAVALEVLPVRRWLLAPALVTGSALALALAHHAGHPSASALISAARAHLLLPSPPLSLSSRAELIIGALAVAHSVAFALRAGRVFAPVLSLHATLLCIAALTAIPTTLLLLPTVAIATLRFSELRPRHILIVCLLASLLIWPLLP